LTGKGLDLRKAANNAEREGGHTGIVFSMPSVTCAFLEAHLPSRVLIPNVPRAPILERVIALR